MSKIGSGGISLRLRDRRARHVDSKVAFSGQGRRDLRKRRRERKKNLFVPHPSHTLGVETVKKNQKNKQLCYSCKCILNVTVTKCPFSEAPPQAPVFIVSYVARERDETSGGENEEKKQ